jgi:hypothetical protein
VGPGGSGAFFGIFAVFAILIVIIAIAVSHYEKRKQEERQRQLAELAERLGLQYFPGGIDGPAKGFLESLFSWGTDGPEDRLIAQFQGFDPFGVGHSQTIESLMAGAFDGIEWLIFDYQYRITRSTGKSTTTTTYNPTIVAAKLPIMLPWLKLGEESFFTQLGERLGIHDLHFESEEFNRTYRVHCQDRRLAFDFLHPQAIEYLLQVPVRGWQFGGPLIVLTTDNWAQPMEIMRMVRDIKGFVQLIPDYVQQDRGFRLPPGGPLQGIIEAADE